VPPPGGKGTISRIGLLGQAACASALAGVIAATIPTRGKSATSTRRLGNESRSARDIMGIQDIKDIKVS
jgi:hypothetical protein